MRDIRFRAWDKKSCKWLESQVLMDYVIRHKLPLVYCDMEGIALLPHGTLILVDECANWAYPPTEIEIVFYTGLKDKNGKEIYEGDIVSNYFFGEEFATVVFENGSFKAIPFKFRSVDEFTCYSEADKEEHAELLAIYKERWNKSEVIGNIYENPELLGQAL